MDKGNIPFTFNEPTYSKTRMWVLHAHSENILLEHVYTKVGTMETCLPPSYLKVVFLCSQVKQGLDSALTQHLTNRSCQPVSSFSSSDLISEKSKSVRITLSFILITNFMWNPRRGQLAYGRH